MNWADALLMLGMGLQGASGAPQNPAMFQMAMGQQNRRREAQEFAKVGQAIIAAKGDPDALNALRPTFQSPAAAKMLETAILKAETAAEARAAREQVVRPAEALFNRTTPVLGPSAETGEPTLPPVPQQTYRHEVARIPGANKVYDLSSLPEDPTLKAAEKDAVTRAETPGLVDREAALRPGKVQTAVDTATATGPINTEQKVAEYRALIGPKIEQALAELGIVEPARIKAAVDRILAEAPAKVAAQQQMIAGTAVPEAQAALVKEQTLAGQRVQQAGAEAQARTQGVQAAEAGLRQVQPNETYYDLSKWDPKNPVKLSKQELAKGGAADMANFSRDQRGLPKFAAVNPQQAMQIDFLNAGVETIPNMRKLGERLLASGAKPGDNLEKALEIYAKRLGRRDPVIEQFYPLRNALKGEVTVAESVRGVPGIRLREDVEKNQMPSILQTVGSFTANMDTLDWILKNRINHILGIDSPDMQMPPAPSVKTKWGDLPR